MTALRTCLACGREAPDVAMRVVAYADPIPVTVFHPVSARRDAVEAAHEVPGRYGAEWRCRDTAACGRRIAPVEPEPAAAPLAADAEEGPSWLG